MSPKQAIEQVDPETLAVVGRFASISDAARAFNAVPSAINMAVNKGFVSMGYRWRRIVPDDEPTSEGPPSRKRMRAKSPATAPEAPASPPELEGKRVEEDGKEDGEGGGGAAEAAESARPSDSLDVGSSAAPPVALRPQERSGEGAEFPVACSLTLHQEGYWVLHGDCQLCRQKFSAKGRVAGATGRVERFKHHAEKQAEMAAHARNAHGLKGIWIARRDLEAEDPSKRLIWTVRGPHLAGKKAQKAKKEEEKKTTKKKRWFRGFGAGPLRAKEALGPVGADAAPVFGSAEREASIQAAEPAGPSGALDMDSSAPPPEPQTAPLQERSGKVPCQERSGEEAKFPVACSLILHQDGFWVLRGDCQLCKRTFHAAGCVEGVTGRVERFKGHLQKQEQMAFHARKAHGLPGMWTAHRDLDAEDPSKRLIWTSQREVAEAPWGKKGIPVLRQVFLERELRLAAESAGPSGALDAASSSAQPPEAAPPQERSGEGAKFPVACSLTKHQDGRWVLRGDCQLCEKKFFVQGCISAPFNSHARKQTEMAVHAEHAHGIPGIWTARRDLDAEDPSKRIIWTVKRSAWKASVLKRPKKPKKRGADGPKGRLGLERAHWRRERQLLRELLEQAEKELEEERGKRRRAEAARAATAEELSALRAKLKARAEARKGAPGAAKEGRGKPDSEARGSRVFAAEATGGAAGAAEEGRGKLHSEARGSRVFAAEAAGEEAPAGSTVQPSSLGEQGAAAAGSAAQAQRALPRAIFSLCPPTRSLPGGTSSSSSSCRAPS